MNKSTDSYLIVIEVNRPSGRTDEMTLVDFMKEGGSTAAILFVTFLGLGVALHYVHQIVRTTLKGTKK